MRHKPTQTPTWYPKPDTLRTAQAAEKLRRRGNTAEQHPDPWLANLCWHKCDEALNALLPARPRMIARRISKAENLYGRFY